MAPFTTLDGVAAPLPIDNVDTDQILPKQFLKTVTRAGLAHGLFYDFRFASDGKRIKDFVLNTPPYNSASILVAGANFGCGSSREHAPWALTDFGIRCVIAPSFADIFMTNCVMNGLLAIVFDAPTILRIQHEAAIRTDAFHISLPDQLVRTPSGENYGFEIDPQRKHRLLCGMDAIAETLLANAKIDAFEAARAVGESHL